MGEEIGSVCINGMTTDFLFFGCVSSRLGGRIFLSILIVNIANLVKAKRYLSAGNFGSLADRLSGFNGFIFWPSALKFQAVLSFLVGFLMAGIQILCAVGVMKTKDEPTISHVLLYIEDALLYLLPCLFITICLLVVYGVFRLILHIMYQRSIK